MTEFSEQLSQKLKEQGLSEAAIQRVLSTKERMRIPDHDPFFDMLLAMEWYVKQMESIPQKITEAEKTTQLTLAAETDNLVQRSVYKFSHHISKTLNQTMKLKARAHYWQGFTRGCACMLVMGALCLTIGYSLHGNWPSYFNPAATDSAILSFIYGALQLPSYITVLALLLVGPVVSVAEKLIQWKKVP